MRAKAWLFENGHIEKDGRGRMPKVSKKNGESVSTLLANSGVKFSDWPKGAVTTAKDTGEVTVERAPVESNGGVVEPIPYRFLEEEFKAVEFGTKKVRSMREACNNCRRSLVVCYCEEPRIVACNGSGSIRVSIERK